MARAFIRDAVDDDDEDLLAEVALLTSELVTNAVIHARTRVEIGVASYNGTAPIEASSGPKKRHRVNPRGNRQLNHAMHMAAVTQIRSDTAGRAHYLRKIDEGETKKEALRALKRRISDAVYRQLLIDADRARA